MATNILFAGQEDTSFTYFGTIANPTATATNVRTAWARIGLCANAASVSVADPPVDRIQAPTFTPQSNFYCQARYCNNGTPTYSANATMLRLLDAGTARLVVRGTGTSGQLKIDKRNAAGTFTNLVTSASGALPGQASPGELKLFVNYAVAGQVTLYFNNVAIATFSGDVTTDSATTLNQLELCQLTSGTNLNFWSEVIVADGDTTGMGVFTMAPQAAGNTQAWTPNTLANINKTTINDATLISTVNNNDLSQWTQPAALPAGTWAVQAIVQEARLSVGLTGPQHAAFSIRTGGADFVTASQAPTTAFTNMRQITQINPNTGVAFLATDLTTAGFNLGVKALA